MFSYNPIERNRSGEILSEGLRYEAEQLANARIRESEVRAAMDANAGKQIGQGIQDAGRVALAIFGGPAGMAAASQMGGGGGGGGGGLFDTIIGAYAQKEQDKSDSKIYGNLMKIVAPAFGKDGDSMLEQWNSLESDRDKARFGSTLFSSLGQISNMYMANRNAGIRENQQALTAAMPRVREAAAAQGRVAAGQGTMGVPANVNLDYVR
jgi:hypothetical protein